MHVYLQMLRDLLNEGERHNDRTGVGTLSLFGYQARFNLRVGFPLLTTKRVGLRWVAEELLWFLSGDTDERNLRARGVDIWKEWADLEHTSRFGREEGDLGAIYGFQWRHFGAHYGGIKTFAPCAPCQAGDCNHCEEPDGGCAHRCQWADSPREPWRAQLITGEGVDQIAELLHDIKHSPNSRRLIVTAWNPRDVKTVDLPPCHTLFHFKVHEEAEELSCHLFMRSADSFLGVPFNIASYALLTHLVALVTGLKPRSLVVSYTDLHLYMNHLDAARTQLLRTPRELPRLVVRDPERFRDGGLEALLSIRSEDLAVEGYDPHPAIKAEVAV